MSERVFSPQPVSQYNPITGEARKEIEKSAVDNPKVSKVSDEPVVVAVESVVKESVKVPSKVTSKVSDESVKESVMVPVVKKNVKASSVGTDKLSSENQDKIDLVANKRSSLVVEKIDVVKDKVDVVADKASDALKNKLTGKGKKVVVGKDKDKPKNIASDVVKEKFKPNPKQKVISSEILVLRLSKQQENPEVKAKVEIEVSDVESLPKKGNKKLTKKSRKKNLMRIVFRRK
nr:hypothetical protein [Tanacetum cinerariifolium]